jgi:hypothetical protein
MPRVLVRLKHSLAADEEIVTHLPNDLRRLEEETAPELREAIDRLLNLDGQDDDGGGGKAR